MRKNPNRGGNNSWKTRDAPPHSSGQGQSNSYHGQNYGGLNGFRQTQPTTSGNYSRNRFQPNQPNTWRPQNPNGNQRNRVTSESSTNNQSNRQHYNNRRQHSLETRNRYNPGQSQSQVQCRSEEFSDIPGFSYDPATGKYFKILPNAPGQPYGSTRNDLAKIQKAHEIEAKLQAQPVNSHISIPPLTKMLQDLTLGVGPPGLNCAAKKMANNVAKYRVSKTSVTPSYTVEVLPNFRENIVGCEFLEVTGDGKTIVGCWAVDSQAHSATNRGTSHQASHIVCLGVETDRDLAQHESIKLDSGKNLVDSNGRYYCNTYGLKFIPKEHDFYMYDPALVDMMIAPIDTEVTCLLYASANSHFNANHQVVTTCNVYLKPIIELTKDEGLAIVDSPIYNMHWSTREAVWSCAWNESKTSIGIGLEYCGLVIDPISDSKFKVSSGNKNVLSQRFSTDGNLLYLGRRNADMSSLDLRMSHHHTIGVFEDSASTGWIHQMKHRSNYILSENMNGKIKLWDIRSFKCIEEFYGHKNSRHRLPCFVDPTERFLFAVDEDGVSRGWSLTSTELLCTIPCPRAVESRADFPRIIFSENWGGIGGNSAIILAVDNELRIHELLL
uniref:Uncharacterized protein n=1 Tax=Acrobeloides nanus TaxID=290746 RepID=A0A914DX27_9BILA